MTSRYAIFYAPDETTELWRFAARWLGRDPVTGELLAPMAVDGLAAGFVAALTEAPRHYGLHATLKPPFALAEGACAADLVDALEAFAARQTAFAAPALALGRIGRFLALTLSRPSADIDALARACVREFDRFRAPPTEAELAWRRRPGLNARQETMLTRWGYPYVFDEFRFHLTLTGQLGDDDRARVAAALAPHVAPLCAAPLPVGSVCLYRQMDRETPFTVIRRFAFGG